MFFIFSTSVMGLSQYHDNVWTFGYSSNPDSTTFGGTNLYFNDDKVSSEYKFRDIEFVGNLTASISDADGNLLMMFNGCTLNDAQHNTVEGSEMLVRNDTQIEQDWWCLRGYNNPGGAFFLPDPYDDERYYLFYRDIIQINEQPYVLSDSMFLASIRFDDDVPYVEYKTSVIEDYVSITGISAVRHANGKDWWVMVKARSGASYHSMLVNEAGVTHHSTYSAGTIDTIFGNGHTTKISPDGKYFAAFDPYIGLQILEVDRATGLMSDYIFESSWVNTNQTMILDIEFSPSGQYLYVAEQDTLWQFDIWVDKEDFYDTKTVVGIYDGFIDFFPTNFWLMQTARDGKIYMSSRNGTKFLHVIHQPDEAGEACDFRQHDYELPTVNSFAMPYFPNYRLGADPTYVSTEEVVEPMRAIVYPNPSRDLINVEAENIRSIKIISLDGQQIISSNSSPIEISSLPSAMYFIEIYYSDGYEVQKITVSR